MSGEHKQKSGNSFSETKATANYGTINPTGSMSSPSGDVEGIIDDDDRTPIIHEQEGASDRPVANAAEHKPLLSQAVGNTSTNRTFMNFLRSMIGPGCLALPVAVKKSGLWGGVILIFILGSLNLHCMTLLVEAAQYLCKRSARSELDYGHLAKKAVDFGPERYRKHSKKALYVTNAVIVALQIGICSVQFVFMASHVTDVVNDLTGHVSISVVPCMAILLIPVILLNYIRSVDIMSFFSTLANILMIIVFCIIFYAVTLTPMVPGPRYAFTNVWNTSMAVGAILYAFEGQAVILPLENRMLHPEEMVGYTGVLNTGMWIVISLYAATGFFGYHTYGPEVRPSITLSLPNTPLYDLSKILLVIGVYVGYGLQLYVVIAMLWPPIRRKWLPSLERWHLLLEYVFRTFLVVVTFALAALVPNLDAIISLVGISAGVLIAFILPPIVQIVTFWDLWVVEKTKLFRALVLTKNVALILLGLFGLFFGLYATIDSQL